MHRARIAFLLLILAARAARAQTEVYVPYRNRGLWHADTLYVGAGFVRLDGKPVTIWLTANEAGWQGRLSYVDDSTGVETPLFSNYDEPGRPIVLTDLVDVPIGKPLTFVYRVEGRGIWSVGPVDIDKLPKYTGPNRKGGRFVSPASSDDNVNPSFRFGHRWSVAGKSGAGRLEFGFEDDATSISDMDFDDIIFGAEGLTLTVFQRSAKRRSYIW